MTKRIALLIFSLYLCNSFARKPAVQPVQGISIDQYKQVPASQIKGFDFDTNRTPAMKSQNLYSGEENEISVYGLFIVLMILHIGAWFFISRRSKQSNDQDDNDNHDDYDFHKAS